MKNHIRENYSVGDDISNYCKSILTGLTVMTQLVDCQYKELVRLLIQYDIYYDKVSDTLYSWYTTSFRMAETAQDVSINAETQRIRNLAIEDFVIKSFRVQQKLFKDLDYTIQIVAEQNNF